MAVLVGIVLNISVILTLVMSFLPSSAGPRPLRMETCKHVPYHLHTPGGSVASPQSGQLMSPSAVAGALQMKAFFPIDPSQGQSFHL